MKTKLTVRNTSAVAANLYAADARLQRVVRKRVRLTGKFCRELTQFLCPVRYGFMRDHVRDEYSQDGLAFECGWWASDFFEAGLPFYPIYVEHGTYKMRAQPSLGPAFLEAREIFSRELRTDLRGAIARVR